VPVGPSAEIHVRRRHSAPGAQPWLWVAERQNLTTNPNRCLVLGCTDTFGSIPATTHGANTQLTPKLAAMMTAANLAPEWYNYRLDGVQTDYLSPKLFGNSIIEGENVGTPLTQSSCISCHSVSSVKSDGTDGLTLLTTNPVGFPRRCHRAWIRRDFVWSLPRRARTAHSALGCSATLMEAAVRKS
jgi:hypothetical protein